MEHLILIGGPIDLIVELGIRSEGFTSSSVKEASSAPMTFAPSMWPLGDFDMEPVVTPQPHFPIFPKAKEVEKAPVFDPLPEMKAAE